MDDKKKLMEEAKDAKYYSLKDTTPDEIVEDIFASEEEAERKAIENDGYVYAGKFDANTSDEELDTLFAHMADLAEDAVGDKGF